MAEKSQVNEVKFGLQQKTTMSEITGDIQVYKHCTLNSTEPPLTSIDTE